MGNDFLFRRSTPHQARLTSGQGLIQDHTPLRMVIAASTGLGLLLVKNIAALSDSFPSILASIFPTAPALTNDANYGSHTFAKREELSETKKIIYGCLIPVLVILSGVFAGLTLGYMSLDETQLNVLSISGTP
jgi:hypothetical protein